MAEPENDASGAERTVADRVLPALGQVFGLLAGGEHTALLRGALECGLLGHAVAPVTVDELAETLHRDPAVVRDLCVALDAHGILDRDGATYQVSAQVAPLLEAGAAVYVADLLRYGTARQRLVEQIVTQPGDYWTADPETQAALAAGVTLPPHTGLARELIGGNYASIPDVRAVLESGGRYLELGCGVAGALLTSMQLFPRMTAVAVELSDSLLDRARQRARELGVDDRVRFVQGDATAFHDPEPFDLVFWSQFFFPHHARPAALDAAHRSLRPGGYLVSPLMAEPSVLVDDLHSPDGREAAMDRLVHGSWGVPARGGQDLVDEFTSAGFGEARLVSTGPARMVVARRPS